MNITNKIFYDRKVTVDKASLPSGVAEDIIKSISTDDGTAKVIFKPITDTQINRAESVFGSILEDGFDKYLIFIDNDIEIYYSSEISKIYAAYNLRNIYDDGISCGVMYARAVCETRGYKCYLPHKNDIEYFKTQIDLILLLGYNTLTLELGGAFEYKSHPEINSGWVEYCSIFKEYNGKTWDTQRIYKFPKDSIHIETGEGDWLTEEQMTQILDYCRERGIEVIPEMPCLSHADYILYAHPEFAEDPEEPLPSFACASNDGYYKLLFELFDDVIRVFKPARINVGHDEGYVFGLCEKCRQKTSAELLEQDIKRIHDHLSSRGVATMLWGDKLCSSWHGGNPAYHIRSEEVIKKAKICGKEYKVRSFKCHSRSEFDEYIKKNFGCTLWYVDETFSCASRLPKDIQVVNWSWGAEKHEEEYRENGFVSIFGNWQPFNFKNFYQRLAKEGIKGVSVSNWGSLDPITMQRSFTYYKLFGGSASLWCDHYDVDDKSKNTLEVSKWMFEYFNREKLKKQHIEIYHYCDFDMPHISFDCGYWIESEDFHIGDYNIEFEDGSSIVYPIIWGENIGPGIGGKGAENAENLGTCLNVMEPAGISMPCIDSSGNMVYKIVIPTDKKVSDIKLTTTEKCKGSIQFRYKL